MYDILLTIASWYKLEY